MNNAEEYLKKHHRLLYSEFKQFLGDREGYLGTKAIIGIFGNDFYDLWGNRRLFSQFFDNLSAQYRGQAILTHAVLFRTQTPRGFYIYPGDGSVRMELFEVNRELLASWMADRARSFRFSEERVRSLSYSDGIVIAWGKEEHHNLHVADRKKVESGDTVQYYLMKGKNNPFKKSTMALQLERYVEWLRKSPIDVTAIYGWGSYFNGKPNPNDIDLCCIYEAVEVYRSGENEGFRKNEYEKSPPKTSRVHCLFRQSFDQFYFGLQSDIRRPKTMTLVWTKDWVSVCNNLVKKFNMQDVWSQIPMSLLDLCDNQIVNEATSKKGMHILTGC